MRLFGRSVALQIGTAGSTGREYTGLRVSFDVEMSDEATPNKAKVKVYNINEDSRSLASKDDAVVRLLVGYDVPLLVFQGNPIEGGVRLDRTPPDRILTLECQDGGREYSSSVVNLSITTPRTAKQLFNEIASTMGLPLGRVDVDDSIRFNSGLTLSGHTRDILNDLAEISGAKWSIRDGTLFVIGNGEVADGNAVVFRGYSTPTAGGNMVGSPVVKDGEVEVKALISPSLRPGDLFRVESADVNGDYKATSVTFKGDTHTNEFYVIARGTPI